MVIGSVLAVPSPAHADLGMFVGAENSIGGGDCVSGWFSGTCTSTPATTVQKGDLILVHYECDVQTNIAINDTFVDSFTIINNDLSIIEWAFASSAGNLRVTVVATCLVQSSTPDGRFAVNIFRNIVGVGTVRTDTVTSGSTCNPCTSIIALTINQWSLVYEAAVFSVFGSACATINNGGSQITTLNMACHALSPGFTGGRTVYNPPSSQQAGTFNYIMSITTSGSPSPNNNVLFHYAVELFSTGVTNVVLRTQCYGNCGNPAVTLGNTNSTKGINFNLSITLLYEFQSNLNGFVNNVTTNLAKATPSNQIIDLGLYIQTCPAGTLPMTAACPATLKLSANNAGPAKGRLSLSAGSGYVVTAGDWLVIAVSVLYSGVSLNDTNTPVSLFSTNGEIPPVISSAAAMSPSNIGLWAWITGTIVTGPPPTIGPCVNNFAQLDCLIPGMVNSACSVVTASCQTSGALFWIIILTFLSFLVATVGFSSAHITKFVGAGEVFMFLFLGWFFIFVGVGVLQSFVVIFFLFIGSVAFAKTARNYF